MSWSMLAKRIEEEMRLDLRLQRFHARFEHRALELLGFGPLGGLVGGQLRPALAARHHLDDEGGDDEQKASAWEASGCRRRGSGPGTTRAAASSTTRRPPSRRSPTTSRRCPCGSRERLAGFPWAARQDRSCRARRRCRGPALRWSVFMVLPSGRLVGDGSRRDLPSQGKITGGGRHDSSAARQNARRQG